MIARIKKKADELRKTAKSKAKSAANAFVEKLDDLVETEAEKRAEAARKEQTALLVDLERKNTSMLARINQLKDDNEQLRQTCENRMKALRAARNAKNIAIVCAWVFGGAFAGLLIYSLVG